MKHNMEVVRQYLQEHGYKKSKIEQISSGFDINKHVYKNIIHPGDKIYQFVRRSSASSPLPNIGNWFCLAGATMDKLAIISGGEGRDIAEVNVNISIEVLEGIASKQAVNWEWSGGGSGGNTQIFIPNKYLVSHISVIGYRPHNNEKTYSA